MPCGSSGLRRRTGAVANSESCSLSLLAHGGVRSHIRCNMFAPSLSIYRSIWVRWSSHHFSNSVRLSVRLNLEVASDAAMGHMRWNSSFHRFWTLFCRLYCFRSSDYGTPQHTMEHANHPSPSRKWQLCPQPRVKGCLDPSHSTCFLPSLLLLYPELTQTLEKNFTSVFLKHPHTLHPSVGALDLTGPSARMFNVSI